MQQDQILSSYQALCTARSPWEGWWDTLRHYVLPSRLHEEESVPDAENAHALGDTIGQTKINPAAGRIPQLLTQHF